MRLISLMSLWSARWWIHLSLVCSRLITRRITSSLSRLAIRRLIHRLAVLALILIGLPFRRLIHRPAILALILAGLSVRRLIHRLTI
jgi:hypothetical protein